MRDFEAAGAINPRDPRAWINRGVTHHMRRDFVAALQSYTQALNLAPKDARACCGRGGTRFFLGYVAWLASWPICSRLYISIHASHSPTINARKLGYSKVRRTKRWLMQRKQFNATPQWLKPGPIMAVKRGLPK
ncbi:MAG: tetratricopeptide repeat protein [Blastocatellia bacterium]